MLPIYRFQKQIMNVSCLLRITIAGSRLIRCRFFCHSYARVHKLYACVLFLFLSLSSVVSRVSARLSSSGFGRVSTQSAMSWDTTPLFGYAVDRLYCRDILYVYSVNTVGVLSIGCILLVIYWHFYCLSPTGISGSVPPA